MQTLRFFAVLVIATAIMVSAQQDNSQSHDALPTFVKRHRHKGADHPTPTSSSSSIISDRDIVAAFTYEADPTIIPWAMQHNSSRHLLDWYHTTQTESVGGVLNAINLTVHPQQLHLAMTADPNTVSVSWTTSKAASSAQVCWYPTSTPNATQCIAGSSWTYHPISVIRWNGMLHRANMTDLIPGVSYTYRVGDATLNVFSDEVTFTAPNTKQEELLIALGGDMGSIQLFGHYVAKQMRSDELQHKLRFDAFWLIGDIAYSTLDPPKDNFEFFWDMFMQQEESFVNHIPFHVTYGNHDYAGGDSGAFINRFAMPQEYPGNANFYWAQRHGPIFYVSMCTEMALNPKECDYNPGSAQFEWLNRTLGSVNRSETPWLVLAGHRPMYSSDKSTDSGPLQQYIEPLLKLHGVDVELAGHMHETELISPVYNNTAYLNGVTQTDENKWTFNNPEAPVHITVGNLGAIIHESFVEPQPKWSLYRNGTFADNAYGYTQLRATSTSLHFTCLRNSGSNHVMWDVVIQKQN